MKNEKENIARQSETLHEFYVSLSVCSEAFFQFNGQNYLFKLLRTIELLKIKLELLINYQFLRNNIPALHTRLLYNLADTILSIFYSENTHRHIPDIRLRYIDIAVTKSLLPMEGKRIMVAWRVASGKNPFGA